MQKRSRTGDQSRYAGIPKGDMRIVADELGADIAHKLMHHLGGLKLYIPKSVEYRRWFVETYFDGGNHQKLAMELGVSGSTINSYVKALYNKPKAEERQQSLFG